MTHKPTPTHTHTVLNISCYKFIALPDAQTLRDVLHQRATAADLKGTILLAGEGINFFLAGAADAVRGFVDTLRTDARFADLAPKESWSATVPFRKMLVKVKREIIRMDHPAIQPEQGRAPPVAPARKKLMPSSASKMVPLSCAATARACSNSRNAAASGKGTNL